MDKKTQNLDPQLKATYERVMGTNLSQSNSTSTPQPTVPPAQASTPPQPAQSAPPVPTPTPPTPASSTPYTPPPQPTVTAPPVSPAAKVVAGGSSDAKVVAGGSKKSGGLSPILVAVAILLFFTIYTIVWLFVFKVKLPFIQ